MIDRRKFLTGVAAGVATALAPKSSLTGNPAGWAPSSPYKIGDVISHDGADYIVQLDVKTVAMERLRNLVLYEEAETVAAKIQAMSQMMVVRATPVLYMEGSSVGKTDLQCIAAGNRT